MIEVTLVYLACIIIKSEIAIAFSENSGGVHSEDNQRWQHFIGSSVGGIDVSPDGSLMVCSTYAGSISIFKMDQGQSAPYEIGNGGHTEYRRWLVWKNEYSLLPW